MTDRSELPVQDRPARPLRGKRAWLSYRTMGDQAPMPIDPVIPAGERQRFTQLMRFACASAGHPMNYLRISRPLMRVCECGQICCEERRRKA